MGEFLNNNGGGLAQAGVSLGLGLMNYMQGKEQIKEAKKQREELERMNQWEKDKYNATLKAQKDGISTLGNAFAGLSQSQSATNAQSSLNQSATTSQSPAQTAELKEKEGQPLPTQRV